MRFLHFFFFSSLFIAAFTQNDQALHVRFREGFPEQILVESGIIVHEEIPLRIVSVNTGVDLNVREVTTFLPEKPVVIESFHPQIIARFPNTFRVWLSGVRMRRIGLNSFSNCINIQTLLLFDNFIEEIPANVFRNCINLQYIELGMNLIERVTPESFVGLVRLDHLSLMRNRLTTINAQFFTNLPLLRQLRLNHNPFQGIPIGTIPPYLENLDLSAVGFTELHQDYFRNFTQLRNLIMDENSITQLPPGLFTDALSLVGLSLDRNLIRRLNSNSFGLHPNMTYFYIHNSTLDEIQFGLFNHFPNLLDFDTRHNPCADLIVHNVSSIDFTEDQVLHQCFANWFVPRPENNVQVESEA